MDPSAATKVPAPVDADDEVLRARQHARLSVLLAERELERGSVIGDRELADVRAVAADWPA